MPDWSSDADAYIEVEVVYALPGEPFVAGLRLPAGSTVAEAIDRSGILHWYPELRDDLPARVGVFGRPVAMDRILQSHDRVEVYRPLEMSPKEARRLRAKRRGAE